MLLETLVKLYRRDLEKLKAELLQYQDERNLWRTDKNIANSAGNLSLHLVGNLNTYIGANLGNSGYIRHRDLEFSLKNIPRETLIANIDDTIRVIGETLPQLTLAQLEDEYPTVATMEASNTEYFLVHLLGHLNYHLGQINYHRRLLDVAE